MTVYKADLTGDYRTTIYDRSRHLLAHGADPADIIEAWRDGRLSMTGKVGEFAKWAVAFKASGPCLVPYGGSLSAPLAGEMGEAGYRPIPVRHPRQRAELQKCRLHQIRGGS
jgi:hypothetical protein